MTAHTNRFAWALVVAATTCGVFLSVRDVFCQDDDSPAAAAQTIFTQLNEDRADQGLQPLKWNDALAKAASVHAQAMASSGTLSHQLPGEKDVAARSSEAGAHFRSVAENVAYGPNPLAIERQWMHSVPHRANILDPSMNSIGIAVVLHAGQLWAVEDFANAIANLSPKDVETQVGVSLQKLGIAVVSGEAHEKVAAARAACPGFEGTAGAHARFVVRWETGDLDTLPQPVVDAIHSGQYTASAVGACLPVNTRNQSFTTYRVAVLLF